MEALEELAVSYERQDGDIVASNQEKSTLQCEVEKLQVNHFVTCLAFPYWMSHSMLSIFILHSTVRGTGEDTAVPSHSGGVRDASSYCN